MKKRLIYCFIAAILITSLVIMNSYALFENETNATFETDIGKWLIKLNDEDISQGYEEELVIDGMVYTTNANVQEGYIAPGLAGYFDIEIDPGNTEVAIEYEIKIDTSEFDFPDNMIFSVENLGGSQLNINDDVYSGVMSLNEIDSGSTIKLRVGIEWENNSEYDLNDGEIGSIKNNSIKIPIDVRISQYIE